MTARGLEKTHLRRQETDLRASSLRGDLYIDRTSSRNIANGSLEYVG